MRPYPELKHQTYFHFVSPLLQCTFFNTFKQILFEYMNAPIIGFGIDHAIATVKEFNDFAFTIRNNKSKKRLIGVLTVNV